MLNVQEYLLNNSLEELKDEYDINVKEYDDFYVFNYGIKSPRFHPIADECRALILSKDFKNVYCRSFNRFYNYGEGDTGKNFNFSNATCYEKLDGSLVNLWFNPVSNQWQFSTRKMGYAEGQYDSTDHKKTFHSLILQAINNDLTSFTDGLDKDITYIFELTSPFTRIVKPYTNVQLWSLDARNKNTGEYVDTYVLLDKGISFPYIYDMSSYDDIVKSFDDLPYTEEGYVLCDKMTNERLKIKNMKYVAVHNLRGEGSLVAKRIIQLILEDQYEEYVLHFPDDKVHFDPYVDAIKKLDEHIHSIWEDVKHIEEQKEFALKVKDYPFASILFGMKKGLSYNNGFNNLKIDSKVNLIEKFRR